MSSKGISVACLNGLVLGCVLLVVPVCAVAQHHGGAGASAGQGSLHTYGRPDGVDEKDDLKDFHEALALQATSEQIAEYQKLIKATQDTQAQLHALLQEFEKQVPIAELTPRHTALSEALNRTRTGTKNFVDGFSSAQKSGLKDITKRLAKADLDLELGDKTLDTGLQDPKAVASVNSIRATALEKSLTEFENQQLALGRQMSIVLASGQDSTFMLPRVKSSVQFADHTVEISSSGTLSQTAAEPGLRTFKLEWTANLSDLQQSMTELLRSRFSRSEACGERIAIRQASLMPATPAIVADVQLHYERWLCTHMYGQQVSNELAEGDAAVEVKVMPSLGQSNSVQLSVQLGRVDAKGMIADDLLSGDLGVNLRDAIRQIILPVVQTGTNFTAELPPAVQDSVTLETARFQEAGVGNLSVLLDGQLQMTDQQANALASRLNQSLTAQGTSTR